MKGLRKIIYPFAPDQSGATSVFYELGGIIVICDAGGCAGNVCGFDEPRWFVKQSAIFSAGLRDMDAILGRDEQMVDKMVDVANKLDAAFAVVIGTPVPATIATDYRAVKRMAEKRLGIPVMTVDTNGIRWYDSGIEKAYVELFETFAEDPAESVNDEKSNIQSCNNPSESEDTAGTEAERTGDNGLKEDSTKALTEPGRFGVLGATPLDLGSLSAPQRIADRLKADGAEKVCCYGFGGTLDDVREAGLAEKNLVIAPSGLKAAKYLKKRFGTPFEFAYPNLADVWHTDETGLAGKKVLIVHQQVLGCMLRDRIREQLDTSGLPAAEINVATWFMLKRELKEAGDLSISDEDRFVELVLEGGYDVVIGDRSLQKAVMDFKGEWIHLPHFAVSGEIEDDVIPDFYV